MKIRLIAIIIVVCMLILSCTTKSEKTDVPAEKINEKTEEKSEEEDNSEEVNATQAKTSKVAFDAVSRTKLFFEWYKSNRNEFYNKQAACVIVSSDDYYMVDSVGVNAYIDFLYSTSFFSQEFIQEVKGNWYGYCHDEMEKDRKNGLKADGPPNCVYEGDIIFKIQEDPSPMMYEDISFTEIKKDSVTTEVKTNSAIFFWKLENGTWKIKDLY